MIVGFAAERSLGGVVHNSIFQTFQVITEFSVPVLHSIGIFDLKHYYQSMDLQNTLIRFSGLKVYLKVAKIRLGEIGPELSLAKYFPSLLCVLLKITK